MNGKTEKRAGIDFPESSGFRNCHVSQDCGIVSNRNLAVLMIVIRKTYSKHKMEGNRHWKTLKWSSGWQKNGDDV